MQIRLAIGLCGLALLLALPILDFGAISASSQMARLESGKVKAEEFDWTAMAFDFGPSGRKRLAEIEKSGPLIQRQLAKAALASKNRYEVGEASESVAEQSRLQRYLRLLSPDIVLTPKLRSALTGHNGCNDRPCALIRVDPDRLLLVYSPHDSLVASRVIKPADLAKKEEVPSPAAQTAMAEDASHAKPIDLSRADIELRKVERLQLYVDGLPVEKPFE
jgi:hypothetical protein